MTLYGRFNSSLQSSIKVDNKGRQIILVINIFATINESISRMMFLYPISHAFDRPNLTVQISAYTLVVIPRCMLKSQIHLPFGSLIRPPAPTRHGLSITLPSMFNFMKS